MGYCCYCATCVNIMFEPWSQQLRDRWQMHATRCYGNQVMRPMSKACLLHLPRIAPAGGRVDNPAKYSFAIIQWHCGTSLTILQSANICFNASPVQKSIAVEVLLSMCKVLIADRTAHTVYRLLAWYCRPFVCLSVCLSVCECDAVHCGARGRYRCWTLYGCTVVFLGKQFLFTSSDLL